MVPAPYLVKAFNTAKASENKIFAKVVVFFLTTVAPIDVVGLQDLGPLGNPFFECNVI